MIQNDRKAPRASHPIPRSGTACALLILFFAAGCGGGREVVTRVPPPEPPPQAPPVVQAIPRVMGYHAYWTNDAWEAYPYDVLDAVLFFDLEVGAGGRITNRHGWPDRWLPMQRHAAAQGTAVVPVVSLMNAETFIEVFQSESAQTVLLDEIMDLFADFPETAGVQLDFEVFQQVPSPVRAAVTEFVRRLDEEMERTVPGRNLSMFMLAYDERDVFDEAALARSLDFVVVQGYDLHARGDEQAGPVAATEGWGRRNWQFVVDRFVNLGVSRDKIVMAVPYFGYLWPTESEELRARTRGAGVSLTLAPVDSAHSGANRLSARSESTVHGVQRDPESDVPYYTFTDTSGAYQGWFEDEQSLEAKYRFVVENGLRGVAIFPLAYGDEQTTNALRRHFRKQ